MLDFLFSGNAVWYTVPAIIGTVFFTFRIVLMLTGVADHAADGFDAVHDVDALHADSTHAFEVLSIQSIAAFAMGFGWGGFAAYRSEFGPVGTNLTAAACGGGMMWLLAVGLRAMYDLQTSGNIPMTAAVGKEGDVYVTIPGTTGRGQVRLTLDERQRFYDAIAEEQIPTGSRIRVLKVNDDNTLTVSRA